MFEKKERGKSFWCCCASAGNHKSVAESISTVRGKLGARVVGSGGECDHGANGVSTPTSIHWAQFPPGQCGFIPLPLLGPVSQPSWTCHTISKTCHMVRTLSEGMLLPLHECASLSLSLLPSTSYGNKKEHSKINSIGQVQQVTQPISSTGIWLVKGSHDIQEKSIPWVRQALLGMLRERNNVYLQTTSLLTMYNEFIYHFWGPWFHNSFTLKLKIQ